MSLKNAIVFTAAAAVFLLAAGHRFNDSSHAMGLIQNRGGKVLHGIELAGGMTRYTVIATATVLPPYRGDARVVLEGSPPMSYALYDAVPSFDLGIHRRPRFEDGVYHDLRPGDRLALWMTMASEKAPPPAAAGSGPSPAIGCAGCPAPLTGQDPAAPGIQPPAGPDLSLAFYDTRTDRSVLRIPVRFITQGAANHASNPH